MSEVYERAARGRHNNQPTNTSIRQRGGVVAQTYSKDISRGALELGTKIGQEGLNALIQDIGRRSRGLDDHPCAIHGMLRLGGGKDNVAQLLLGAQLRERRLTQEGDGDVEEGVEKWVLATNLEVHLDGAVGVGRVGCHHAVHKLDLCCHAGYSRVSTTSWPC